MDFVNISAFFFVVFFFCLLWRVLRCGYCSARISFKYIVMHIHMNLDMFVFDAEQI